MKHRQILAAALLTLTALPAQANGDWTGFYAGGQIGWADVEYPTSNPAVPGGILFDGQGHALGLHAGYNHDFGTIVLGAEISVDFPSLDIVTTLSGVPAPREVDSLSVLKLKAGYDAGRVLPYATVGYAYQDFATTAGGTVPNFDGLAYGLGVSFLTGSNLIAGIEALWFDLDPTEGGTTLTSEGSLVSLRLSYRF